MIKIPSEEKRIMQICGGDVFGNVLGSFNLDLIGNPGTFRITRMLKTTDGAVTDFGVPVAFKYFGNAALDAVYAICGGYVFRGSSGITGNFTKLTSPSGAPTGLDSDDDLEEFNNALYITGGTTVDHLYKLSSSNGFSDFDCGNLALGKLIVYGNRLYAKSGNTLILSINTSDTPSISGANTLQLSGWSNGIIRTMLPATNRIWVCTLNPDGGYGAVFDWDGVSEVVTARHLLPTAGVLSAVLLDDTPYIFDADGVLRAFIGGFFQEVARLPLKRKLLDEVTMTDSSVRPVHPNGMTVDDGEILINIRGTFEDGHVDEYVPSGIWAYNKENGLYHKYSFSLRNYSGGTQLDYGQHKISKVGALKKIKLVDNNDGVLIAGAEIYSDATTVLAGSFIDHSLDTIQKAGYFLTPRLEAGSLKDNWAPLTATIKKFATATDKLVAKFRTSEDVPTEATCTWASTTSFTTTTDITSYEIGDEVEIVNGVGGGLCAHITRITTNDPIAGTYTIFIDETFGEATGTAKIRFSKWIKIDDLDYDYGSVEQVKTLDFRGVARYIQFKIWMTWTGDKELRELLIDNKPF